MPGHGKYLKAGEAKGTYKASLFDIAGKEDKLSFADKIGSWEQEKLSRGVSAIGDTLELASTIGRGVKDREKFETRLGEVSGQFKKQGMELQVDTRGQMQKGWDWLTGKEQTYTFGKGEGAKTLSRAAVSVKGSRLLGQTMLDEVGMGSASTVTSEETDSKEGGSTGKISEYIAKPEALDKAVDSNKNLLESVPEYRQGKGLTEQANTKLYEADPSMEGKSPDERVKRYEELFGAENQYDDILGKKSITNPLGIL